MKKAILITLIIVLVILFFPLNLKKYPCDFDLSCNQYTSLGKQLFSSIMYSFNK